MPAAPALQIAFKTLAEPTGDIWEWSHVARAGWFAFAFLALALAGVR